MKTHQYIPSLRGGTLTLILLGLCLLTACTSGTPNSTQAPTPTPTPTPQSIYELATSRSPFLANSLSNTSNALYPWPEGTDKIGTCLFTGGAYHNIAPTPPSFHGCGPSGVILRDLVFQVQMTIVKGDAGGISFRWSSAGFYGFYINRDGSYELRVDSTIIAGGSSSVIKVGLNQTNLIAVVAHGNTFDLFVNKHYITSVNDTTLSEGNIGIEAHAISKPTEVEFRNAMVWTL
jgi:hypothetical protein